MKNGKIEQLFIPKENEEHVKKWVKNFHMVQELLEKISSLHWNRLKRKG